MIASTLVSRGVRSRSSARSAAPAAGFAGSRGAGWGGSGPPAAFQGRVLRGVPQTRDSESSCGPQTREGVKRSGPGGAVEVAG